MIILNPISNDFFKRLIPCIIIIIIINSCIHYKPIRFSKTIYISNFDKEKPERDNRGRTALLNNYSSIFEDKKGYLAAENRKENLVYLKRYFAEVESSSPVAKINNRGVENARNGKFLDARFIFEEALKEDNNFAPAYNNLGIIFELFHHKDDAFKMYSKACIIDSENEYYRNNFLYFREFK